MAQGMLFPGMMNFRFGNNFMMFGYGMPLFSIINIVLYLFNVARNWYQNHRQEDSNTNANGNADASESAESAHSREETDAAIRPVTDSIDMIIIVVITVVILLYSIFSFLVCPKIDKKTRILYKK